MMLSICNIFESSIISQNRKGQMICHLLPFSAARELKELGRDFKGEAAPIREFHITIGLIHAEPHKKKEIVNATSLLARFIDPYEVKIEKFEIFPISEHSNNHEILVALPEADKIEKVHNLIFDVFQKFKIPIDNGNFKFRPHITVKYIKPKQNIDIEKLKFNSNISIDSLSFVANGKHKTVMLGEA